MLKEVVTFGLLGSTCTGMFVIAPGVWPLDADVAQVHQVLNNLIINAVQAMPDGGTLTVGAANERLDEYESPDLPAGRYVRLTVSDEGCGIPEQNLPKIFDPYFTTKPSGTGLGLASVFSIVRRHGGSIAVSSRPGAGTTFTLLLPAADGHGAESAPSPAPTGPSSADVPGRSVLVMDDEEMIRLLSDAMLAELGYRAVTCANGTEAVNLYRDAMERGEPFSAVILDMTVPGGVGGREAALQILDLDPAAVLIISSGYSVDSTYRGEDDPVFRGAVSKPYTIDQLAHELARLIRTGKTGT